MKTIFSLSNKNILVTGASSGIGRAIAIENSKQGANIIGTARNKEKLLETKEMLSEGKHLFIDADLSDEASLDMLVEQLPLLDGIVLNAGIVKTMPVKYIKKNVLDYMFNVNIQSSILLIQKLLKNKKINSGGSICFISSVATQKATLGNAMYIATKGAVNSFAKALALELAPKQIRVNAIMPGFVETNILEENNISEEQLETHKKNYPIGRFGKPEDVAHLSIYLMSDESKWMTGSSIVIDGGFSIK
ncbi:SDR family oxidoreductase [Flavobacterium chungnamense]|uniref:SDR family oxidoreductase n=1 Tax=Flavobacterium chungnamense TaxID=706182 RepID=A0ABP7UVF7_9FLAO